MTLSQNVQFKPIQSPSFTPAKAPCRAHTYNILLPITTAAKANMCKRSLTRFHYPVLEELFYGHVCFVDLVQDMIQVLVTTTPHSSLFRFFALLAFSTEGAGLMLRTEPTPSDELLLEALAAAA